MCENIPARQKPLGSDRAARTHERIDLSLRGGGLEDGVSVEDGPANSGVRARPDRKSAPHRATFYGVRSGREPGVYRAWDDCKKQTTGFKGAQYKSFPTEEEAQAYVAGKTIGASISSKPSKPSRFYAIAVGLVPGVYEDWDEAKMQIRGVKGPKFKKFGNREEAEEFVRSGGKRSMVPETASTVEEPSRKKVKKGTGKLLRIYTDGSSLGNGKNGACAGVGVFFGLGDDRNVTEALEGPAQTNNRAELTAIIRALEIAPTSQDILILTDSNYSINCCSVWYENWIKKGWKTSVGKAVENKDLIVQVRDLIDLRTKYGSTTDFEWIKGHSNDPGNEAADRLAVTGARRV
ncbi:hypothetical protein B7494_g6646 [Chlorociboria aeruginascens]|nr:hypothetical protein B7494_g6646 [Chlorociboria aeruginascens]